MSATTPLLPDISIRQLEYLVAIDEHDTWAAAAGSLGVSPSALSQGLAELERRVGVELFDHVGRRRVLRGGSRPVLDHARNVVALTSDLVQWAGRIERGERGRVRIGLIDVAAVVHFPDVLRAFRSEHPDVDFTMSVAPSRTLLDDVIAGSLDLAVCVTPPALPSSIETFPLLDEELVVYAPPGTTIGEPREWGPWVLFPSGSHTRAQIEDRLGELGSHVEVAAESHQPDVLREMVELGLGWTVLPRTQGESGPTGVAIGDHVVTRQLVLARRSDSVHDPAADDLTDRLRRSAR